MKNKRTKRILYLVLILIIIAGFYQGLVVRHYNLESDKIIEGTNIKIILVSDLHDCFYGENQENIISKIEEQHADLILLAGDMGENMDYDGATITFMKGAVEIAPTYYVSGNHEYWSYNCSYIKKCIGETGVVVLNSEMVQLEIDGNIIELFGIDDYDITAYTKDCLYETWEELLENMWQENENNNYRILLSHRPECVEEYQKYDYDLVLNGHSHGGQVRIPFLLNGLYAPNQGWFPKYAGGKYEYNNTTQIVSRGLSYSVRLPRIYNPPEIVVIEIEGA